MIRLRTIFTLLLLVLLFLLPTPALAQPDVCGLYGEVTLCGYPVEDGTIIKAWIDNIYVASTYTYTKTDVYPPIPSYYYFTIDGIGHDFEGKQIIFTVSINDGAVAESATYEKGANISLNLTAMEGFSCGSDPMQRIKISPDEGIVANICGEGFTPSNPVRIYFEKELIATTITDSEGKFCIPLIPTTTEPGEYTVAVVDILDRSDQATFTIPVPHTGEPGQRGEQGPPGEPGLPGENGKNASSTLSLVGLIVSIAALTIVVVFGYRPKVKSS